MKKHIMTGLVMLLPIALTFWIVTFLINWLTDPFIDMAEVGLTAVGMRDFAGEVVFFWLTRILVLIFILLFICLIGIVGRYVFFTYLMRLGDSILHRIPVISSVYKTSQELIQTILSSENRAFKQVVLAPFPHAESWTIGLVAREVSPVAERVPVFIPTTPNPTSGYLVMYERTRLIPLSLTIEEAFRYIISAGALLPENASFMLPQKEKELS